MPEANLPGGALLIGPGVALQVDKGRSAEGKGRLMEFSKGRTEDTVPVVRHRLLCDIGTLRGVGFLGIIIVSASEGHDQDEVEKTQCLAGSQYIGAAGIVMTIKPHA